MNMVDMYVQNLALQYPFMATQAIGMHAFDKHNLMKRLI